MRLFAHNRLTMLHAVDTFTSHIKAPFRARAFLFNKLFNDCLCGFVNH